MKSSQSAFHSIQGSHYGFSATRIEDLGAAEYTLVAIAADTSGSVAPFLADIARCMKEVVSACQHSPRAHNLMLRTTVFEDTVDELHGFIPLPDCQADEYRERLRAGGSTALYDAAHNAVEAVVRYGKCLVDHDFEVNAIVFVITDGMDNASQLRAADVKAALERAVQSEALESVTSVLVGVNIQAADVSRYLRALHTDAGFTQYVEIGQANASALAKLAAFVSRSISAQSQALGTGRASQSLTF